MGTKMTTKAFVVKLGRPEGTGLDGAALLAVHKDRVKALQAGQSIRNAAKQVQRVAAALKEK